MVWDEQCWQAIVARQLASCREAGLLAQLVIYVNWMAGRTVWRGDFAAAASLVAEAEAIAAATGTRFAPYGAVALAGFRGVEAQAAPLIEAVITAARAAGQGMGVQLSHWAAAVLYNGLGRYETAQAEAHTDDMAALFVWAPDLRIQAHPVRIAKDNLTAVTGVMTGAFTQPMPDGKGRTIAPTGKAFALDMVTVGIWNRQGTMDEEFFFWDNQTFYAQMGLG